MENETKPCQECKSDIPKDAKRCSHCGAKQKKQYGVGALVIGLAVMFGFFWLIGSSVDTSPSSSSSYSSSGSGSSAPETEQLELLSFSCYNEYGYFHITGQVKNISGKSLDNVTAVGNAYTDSGEFVKSDTALIEYDPILSGQTSPFEVLMTGNPAISKCKVDFKYLFGGSIKTKRSDK